MAPQQNTEGDQSGASSPDVSHLSKPIPIAEDTRIKLENGMIGTLFGARSEKSGNIAGLTVFLSILAILYLIVFGDKMPNEHFSRALTAVSSILSLALGFLFGKRD